MLYLHARRISGGAGDSGTEIKALEDAGIVEKGYIDLRAGRGLYLRRRKRDDRKHRGQARHAASPPAFVAQVGVFNSRRWCITSKPCIGSHAFAAKGRRSVRDE